jgi:hypothetical protein
MAPRVSRKADESDGIPAPVATNGAGPEDSSAGKMPALAAAFSKRSRGKRRKNRSTPA